MNKELSLLLKLMPQNTTETDLEKISEILSVLSKHDALSIFIRVRDGLKSDLETYGVIGLTKKQYYTRLKQLVKLGLITKKDTTYVHTSFGNQLYQQHIIGLIGHLKELKNFEMIDVLKNSSNFKPEDISEFISKITSQTNLDPNLLVYGTSEVSMTLTDTYDDMVLKVLQLIDFAQKEILLISRFRNDHIINSILKKANMGISVKVIADNDTIQSYFDGEKSSIKQDKHKSERMTTVANPFYPSNIERRYTSIPFCLLVIDGKQVGIEIVNSQDPKAFSMSIFVNNSVLANKMKAFFAKQWVMADINVPNTVIAKR